MGYENSAIHFPKIVNHAYVFVQHGDGPYSAACTDVAAFVFRGEPDGQATKDIWMTCRNAGLYAVNSVSGQAFDESGNWNVITGYANCKHPATNPPDHE